MAAAIARLWSLSHGGPTTLRTWRKCVSRLSTPNAWLAAPITLFASYQWTGQARASAAAARALRYITQSATFCAR